MVEGEPPPVQDFDYQRAELEMRREIETTKVKNDFEIRQREVALAEKRASADAGGAAEKKPAEYRTALITILAGLISAGGTVGVAYFGGLFDVAKTDAASRGSIDLEKLKFSNDLVKGALLTNNPANSLMFYADIGLLDGLNADNVKRYATDESARLAKGAGGTSLLPTLSKDTRPWLDRAFMAKFAPNAQPAIVDALVSSGNYLLAGFGINDSAKRLSMFLGQIAYETAGFTKFVENANYSGQGLRATFPTKFDAQTAEEYARQPEKILNRAYADRLGNGPESSGDGWKYRGRGFFQIAGRQTYDQFSKETGIDLVTNPETANDPNVALLIAAIYWSKAGLNELADNGDLKGITRRISGGFGIESIAQYSDSALKLLTEKN